MDGFAMAAVARVRGGRAAATDDAWGPARAHIVLDGRFGPDSLRGLDAFSHLEVVFVFHLFPEAEITVGARHPRGNRDWPEVGIFAQRGRNRPNRIGVSVCRIVTVDGTTVEVEGLDAVDGTPVLDLKPMMSGFLPRDPLREPDWAREVMARYW